MATDFPTALDSFSNPSGTDKVNSATSALKHATQHANANDAIEALEAKVGVDGSAVTTSHDYKLSGVTSSAKAVSNNSNENIAGVKTFTTSQGLVATRPKFVTSIDDTNGNELVKVTATSSAINEITLANAATGGNPTISATGDDNNIGIDLQAKGAAAVSIRGNSTQAGELRLYEDTDDGAHYTGLKAQAMTGNLMYTLPQAQGAANSVLTNNGSGALTWAAPSSNSVTSLMPKTVQWATGATVAYSLNSNTTASVAMFSIPFNITVNKISVNVAGHTTNGTVKIGLYNEDGQTQAFAVTTATITGAGVVTTAVSSVTVTAGNYYLVCLPTGTTSTQFSGYNVDSGNGMRNLGELISSEPVLIGTLTVSADTLPTTFTPSSITTGVYTTPGFRLDN